MYGKWIYSIIQTKVGKNGYIRLIAFRNGRFRVVDENEQETIMGYKVIMNAYDVNHFVDPEFLKKMAVGPKLFRMEDEIGY